MTRFGNSRAFGWALIGFGALVFAAQLVILILGPQHPAGPILSMIAMAALVTSGILNLRRIGKGRTKVEGDSVDGSQSNRR